PLSPNQDRATYGASLVSAVAAAATPTAGTAGLTGHGWLPGVPHAIPLAPVPSPTVAHPVNHKERRGSAPVPAAKHGLATPRRPSGHGLFHVVKGPGASGGFSIEKRSTSRPSPSQAR